MSSTFIPVDLDQVLDEFEEQERNQDSPGIIRPNSLDIPNSYQELKPHSISDPRTYSFNSPLDAILQEHSNNLNKTAGKSLAQELADLDINVNSEHIDDDDDAVDGGSDASSTTAIIAEAEKITTESDFIIDQSTSDAVNTHKDELDETNSDSLTANHGSSAATLNSETPDETDFLSLLKISVVDENPFRLKDTKTTSDNKNKDLSNQSLDDLKHIANLESSVDMSNNSIGATKKFKDDSEENSDNNLNENDKKYCDESVINIKSNEFVYVSNDQRESQSGNNVCGSLESSESKVSLPVDVISKDTQSEPCHTHEISSDGVASFANIELPDGSNHQEEEGLNTIDNINNPSPAYISSTAQDDSLQVENSSVDQQVIGGNVNTSNDVSDNLCVGSEVNSLDNGLAASSQSSKELTSAEHDEVSETVPCSLPSIDNQLMPTTLDNQLPSTTLENQLISTTLENQLMPTTVDSGSADSLCGDAQGSTCTNDLPSTAIEEDNQPSPVRGISPEPQLAEGILPVHISSGDPEMGFVPPIWVPDEVATHCMTCGVKFSMIKRKHHCRACGRVLCSSCCNMKFPLPYLGNKDARVCQVCCDILIQGTRQHQLLTEDIIEEITIDHQDDPQNPDIPSNSDDIPVENGPSTTEQSDNNEQDVLESADCIDESQLSDDVDNEDITEACPSDVATPPVLTLPTDPVLPTNGSSASLTSAPLSPALSDDSDLSFRLDVEHVRAMIPQDFFTLPPVLNLKNKAIQIQEHPDPAEIMYRLKGLGDTIIFLLNKNLIVKVKIVKLKCCVKKKCWCFVSDGMGAANQEEMVVLLECEHNENTVPKDVLSHFNTAFTYAKQGHVVSDLGFTIFGQPFLGSSNNAGFLYIKPTFQCLENLPLPTIPYVVGILIQRQEAPWAQLFPIRLMLRLGTEFRYYPCPLWSVRNRPSVYREVGHTIMNLLTDFKNFQYSIPRITGLVIHMENTKTTIRLPQDRFDEMVKVLNAAEEHMFAFGANFSSEADSHLVCIQEGESYKTQAINIQNTTRKVTGASFVVFSGSLKTSNPNDAKVSIIEDGIMIQMLPDNVLDLRKALREMQDYVITTGSNATANSVTQVDVEWVSRDSNKETYTSPIDGRSLTDVPSIQVHSSCDFSKRDIYRIRWTNVFLERNGSSSRGLSSRGLTRLTGELARACCEALRPYLQGLFDMGLTRLSLRVNIDADSVEYSIGANQKPLPSNLMADLDSALIPSISAAAMKHRRGPLTVELFFSVISLF